jgi:hypothetical protein
MYHVEVTQEMLEAVASIIEYMDEDLVESQNEQGWSIIVSNPDSEDENAVLIYQALILDPDELKQAKAIAYGE